MVKHLPALLCIQHIHTSTPVDLQSNVSARIQNETPPKFKPEAMYTESAFRREELEGSGGEKQPEEGMESAEILRNICEKDVTLFRTAHSKDLNSVSWALRTLVEREPETFFRYL